MKLRNVDGLFSTAPTHSSNNDRLSQAVIGWGNSDNTWPKKKKKKCTMNLLKTVKGAYNSTNKLMILQLVALGLV